MRGCPLQELEDAITIIWPPRILTQTSNALSCNGKLLLIPVPDAAGTGVSHPLGFNQTEPSIAAVVGSMDAKCSRYSAEVQLQGHRVEIIQVRLPQKMEYITLPLVLCIASKRKQPL